MSTLFSDNFNRADSAIVSAANWTENEAGGGAWAIASNQLSLSGGGSFNTIIATTSAHAAIADCRATIKRITGGGYDGGPCVRAVSNGSSMYYLDVYGTNTLEIYRRVASSDTLVNSRAQTHGANDTFSLEVSGSGATVTLKILRNGVQVGADISDGDAARITAAGQMGVISWATETFDDFLAEDLAAPPAETFPAGHNQQVARNALLRM